MTLTTTLGAMAFPVADVTKDRTMKNPAFRSQRMSHAANLNTVRKTALDWSSDVSHVLYDIVPEEQDQIAYYGEFMLMVSYNTSSGQWLWYVSNDDSSVDKQGTAWSEQDAKDKALEVAEDAEAEQDRASMGMADYEQDRDQWHW